MADKAGPVRRGKGGERRTAPRFPVNRQASCRVMAADDTAFQPAELQNVSTGGIKVLLPRCYDEGTILTVALTDQDGRSERAFLVRVVRVSDQADGRCALGCAFLTPPDGHELLTLVL